MSTTILKRLDKGVALTYAEMDTNLENLRTATDGYAAALGAQVAIIQSGQTSGMLGYATKAAMDADLAHVAGTTALVTNDATASNNTFWLKLGASGAGSWQKSALPAQIPVVNASLYADFATAVAAQGSDVVTMVVSEVMAVTTAITVPSTLSLQFVNDGGFSISGGGSISGLPYTRPNWFGSSVSAATIQAAIDACASGGTVDIGDAGAVTITATINITKPCTIMLGNVVLTSALTTRQWFITSPGVSFVGRNPAVSKMVSTDTVSGNIIQRGVRGSASNYDDFYVSGIQFTLPFFTGTAYDTDTDRTKHGAIVCMTESLSVLTPSNRMTVTDCIFNEGTDCISLEQVNYFTSRNNTFYNTKGRGILLWNCDYYVYDSDRFIDSTDPSNGALGAINYNESFQSGSLGKGCDNGKISNVMVVGTRYEAIVVKGFNTTVSDCTIIDAKGTGIAITDPDSAVATIGNVVLSNNAINIIGGGTGAYGIVVSNGATSISGVKISGGVVNMTGGTIGIGIVEAAASNINIDGVTITKSGATAANYDGIIFNGCSDVNVTNCKISGFNRHGVYFNSTTNYSMSLNTIKNNISHGVKIEATSIGLLTNNYLVSNGGYGINVVASDQTYLEIPNTNRYYGNTSGNINVNLMYMGDGTRVDSTIMPLSGYIDKGDIVYRGLGQAASASSGWICTTAGWLLKGAWTTGTSYTAGFMVSNAGNIYIATGTGTSGATAPTHTSGTVSDGVVNWRYVATGSAAVTKTLPAVSA